MKRRLQWFCSCALLCALLVTAALPAPAAAASTGFSDVPESHWAADSIRRAVDLGLFQGQTPTRFGLGAPMTRGAFVVALCRLFGWEMVTPEAGSYTDNQDKSAWYYSAVETAYANGAITRQTDTFRPREPITREELALTLNGKKARISRRDFENAMITSGVDSKVADNILLKFIRFFTKWEEAVRTSFLNREMQERYLALIRRKLG